MTLVEAMGLERARLISVCGAGGKTTLIFAMAREFAASGEKVLITTTTRMAETESRGRFPFIAASSAGEIDSFARSSHDRPGAIIACSRLSANREKLIGFPPDVVETLAASGWFDRILVEADGSRDKPLKAPAKHEPVFPRSSDTVITVAGLNGIGRSLHDDNLFRADSWANLTGSRVGDKITSSSLATMISSREGMARGCPAHASKIVFLNRADSPQRLGEARNVKRALADTGSSNSIRLVAGWLLPEPGVVDLSAV